MSGVILYVKRSHLKMTRVLQNFYLDLSARIWYTSYRSKMADHITCSARSRLAIEFRLTFDLSEQGSRGEPEKIRVAKHGQSTAVR